LNNVCHHVLQYVDCAQQSPSKVIGKNPYFWPGLEIFLSGFAGTGLFAPSTTQNTPCVARWVTIAITIRA
jgi:hypothetical protein